MANNRRPIKFLATEIGFVLFLGYGVDVTPRYAGAVWRSTDAGISWSKVLDGRYTALATVPQAFVVTAGLEGSFSTSHDAGETWDQVKLPVNGDVVAITASDPLNITIATTDPKLLISRDGGKRWTEISMPSRDFEPRDLETTGAGKIWLLQRPTEQAIRTAAYYQWLAHRGNSNDDKADWRTAQQRLLTRGLQYTPDFGRTWIADEAPPSPFDALRRADSDGVFLLSGVYGSAFAQLFENRIKISRMPVDNRINLQETVGPGWCCDAINTKTICFGGYKNRGGFFATTHDGGDTWRELNIYDNGVMNVFFLDNLRGWALVGSYGGAMVWGTLDGGLNWSRLTQPGKMGLSSPFN
jgi:photosystem II stability/assembly factor-like uncharacterized protein